MFKGRVDFLSHMNLYLFNSSIGQELTLSLYRSLVVIIWDILYPPSKTKFLCSLQIQRK